jgi:hypothetical protein
MACSGFTCSHRQNYAARCGCDCDSLACAQVGSYATSRDPQARSIWYTGSNQSSDSPIHSIHPDASELASGEKSALAIAACVCAWRISVPTFKCHPVSQCAPGQRACRHCFRRGVPSFHGYFCGWIMYIPCINVPA